MAYELYPMEMWILISYARHSLFFYVVIGPTLMSQFSQWPHLEYLTVWLVALQYAEQNQFSCKGMPHSWPRSFPDNCWIVNFYANCNETFGFIDFLLKLEVPGRSCFHLLMSYTNPVQFSLRSWLEASLKLHSLTDSHQASKLLFHSCTTSSW